MVALSQLHSGEVLPQPAKPVVFLLFAAGLALASPFPGQTGDQPESVSVRSSASRVKAPKASSVAVENIAAIHDAQGAGIEITSTIAVVPTITKLDGPPRLVIDLPGAVNRVTRSRIVPVQGGEIKTIHVEQLQQNPPVTRVTVDLSEARSYSWEAATDKLVVYLRPPVKPGDKPATEDKTEVAKLDPPPESVTVPVFTKGIEAPITTASTGGAAGVVLAGNTVGHASTVAAGAETSILNLARGGTIRVCPGTTISVTSSQNGRELMLSLSTGSLEAHYSLASSQDSILTPDFRIALPGPGDFAYAFSADAKGNTCVRTLPGNTASAVVSELMGDATYQVKPNEEVVFRNGQIANADNIVPLDCGCPAVQAPTLRAEAPRQSVTPDEVLGDSPNASKGTSAEDGSLIPPVASLADLVPNQPAPKRRATTPPAGVAAIAESNSRPMQIQIEAPLVFRGDQQPRPAPTREAGQLPAVSPSRSVGIANAAVAQPVQPPKQQPKQHTGFFGKVRRFFSSMFG
jgi:AMIN domain-containing protein